MFFFFLAINTHTHIHKRKTDIHMNTVRTQNEKINSLHVLGYGYNQHICSKGKIIIND